MRSLLFITLIAITACTKKHGTPLSCATAPNTITISDNDTTYCIPGNGMRLIESAGQQVISKNVAAICYPSDSNSTVQFYGAGDAFLIGYANDHGPPHGICVYPWTGHYASFKENFPGGQTYSVTAATVTVTTADTQRIQATFVFDLTNASGSKTITGILNTTKP